MVSMQSELPAIWKEAITALSCCCPRSMENARKHRLLLLQAAHIAPTIAVVDLLMKNGLSIFIAQEKPELYMNSEDSRVTPDSSESRSSN